MNSKDQKIFTKEERSRRYKNVWHAMQETIENLSEEMMDTQAIIAELQEAQADIEVQLVIEEVNDHLSLFVSPLIIHSAWIKND